MSLAHARGGHRFYVVKKYHHFPVIYLSTLTMVFPEGICKNYHVGNL
jgi:hypothetical protein